jgi:predicted outer membrane protein
LTISRQLKQKGLSVQPPIPRFVRLTVVLAMITALSVAVFQYWGRSQYRVTAATAATSVTAAPDNGWTPTQWGPLGPADRDLLIKVRQAGLWEGPAGQQAQQRGSSARVREVGRLIAAEHADLDAQVREVSAQLGVALPNQPTDQQRGWIGEIASQPVSDFDRTFVQRLRAAHGKVLPTIAQVRAGTRNDLVRRFATASAQFVTRHHEYLESTRLVDYSALPEAPAPAAAPPAAGAPAAAPAVPPAAAAASTPAAVAPAAVDHAQHLGQVANVTPINGTNVMIAGLVYAAALLAIIGLLALLGTNVARTRRNRPRLQHAFEQTSRPRHAAQRW